MLAYHVAPLSQNYEITCYCLKKNLTITKKNDNLNKNSEIHKNIIYGLIMDNHRLTILHRDISTS